MVYKSVVVFVVEYGWKFNNNNNNNRAAPNENDHGVVRTQCSSSSFHARIANHPTQERRCMRSETAATKGAKRFEAKRHPDLGK